MTRRLALAVSLVLLLVMVVPAVALAGEPTTYTFLGKNADAYYGYDGPDGSVWVNVWGGTVNGKFVGGSTAPERIKEVSGSFNYESYTPAGKRTKESYTMVMAWGPAPFYCDRSLTKAGFAALIPAEVSTWTDVMPWEGAEDQWVDPSETKQVILDVSASWSGSGPLWKEAYSSRTRTDDFFMIDRTNSTRRAATCDATVVDSEGTVWWDGTFADAAIYDTKSGGHVKGMWPE